MRLHTISDTAMEDRIARALNRLGEDADLSTDEDGLLDLLDEYLDSDDPRGKIPPCTHYNDYTTTMNNTIVTTIL